MATNHTTNYSLNLWEPTDQFLRTEFNENTEKLDAALQAHDARMDALASLVSASVVTGSFTPTPQVKVDIDLGFRPKVVILLSSPYPGSPSIGILLPTASLVSYNVSGTSSGYINGTNNELTDWGFSINASDSHFNGNVNSTTHYAAFR